MDFIIGLPKSEDNDSIIVVVDRFSKYATFIAAPTDCTAEETARLFLKHVVKYWGLPKYIISDRDPRFTGKFWTELFKLMGSELHFSTSFHPQTDGQTERVNALLELYLRHFATNKSPFELATGQQPLTPHTLTIGYTGRSPATFKFAKGWHEQADIARSYLDRAAKKMKKWADKKRRHTEYKVGDMVGKVSYKVELPPRLKIHLSSIGHLTVVTSYDKEVEHIIADRIIEAWCASYYEYLVKWKDYRARLAGSQQMHYGSSRSRLSGSGQKTRRGRLRLRWGRVSQDASNDPPHGLYRSYDLIEDHVMRQLSTFLWKLYKNVKVKKKKKKSGNKISNLDRHSNIMERRLCNTSFFLRGISFETLFQLWKTFSTMVIPKGPCVYKKAQRSVVML
ncbi:hypothetical protein AAG906_040033 [Vitis piasezkii]